MHRVLVLVALLGCGDKQLESLEVVRDELCACKTPACGDAAMKKVPQKLKSDPKIQRVAAAMMECRAKLERADRPTTDVDADEPTNPGSVDPASGGTP